jgi:hypothetical protein
MIALEPGVCRLHTAQILLKTRQGCGALGATSQVIAHGTRFFRTVRARPAKSQAYKLIVG